MLRTILSIAGFIIVNYIAIFELKNEKQAKIILYIISSFLLVYKIIEYVYYFIKGYTAFPVEISAVTYFLFSIVCLLRIKKLEQLAVFCALISGFCYMLFYILFGKYFSYGSVYNTYITFINHSLLYFSAILKLKFNKYNKLEYYKVLFSFAIIVFYSWVMKKLFIFNNFIFIFKFMDASIIYMAFPSFENLTYFLPIYYFTIICAILFALRLFYKINRKLYGINLWCKYIKINSSCNVRI